MHRQIALTAFLVRSCRPSQRLDLYHATCPSCSHQNDMDSKCTSAWAYRLKFACAPRGQGRRSTGKVSTDNGDSQALFLAKFL